MMQSNYANVCMATIDIDRQTHTYTLRHARNMNTYACTRTNICTHTYMHIDTRAYTQHTLNTYTHFYTPALFQCTHFDAHTHTHTRTHTEATCEMSVMKVSIIFGEQL